MAQTFQGGMLNTTALVVPDLYVVVQSPSTVALNGVPSNGLGIVGTASWGPVNQPVVFGTPAQGQLSYGPVLNRKYDMQTAAAIAAQQGATSFVGVRVTDGTDAAAAYAVFYSSTAINYPMLLTAVWTGSRGNGISVVIAGGTQANSWKLILSLAGTVPEIFDNIDASAGPAAFWANAVSAVNNGTSAVRGPSALCVATLGGAAGSTPGSGTSTPPGSLSGQTLLGGSDGATSVAASTLVGADGLSRTGMYALRGKNASVGMLADADDPSQWSVQGAFGLSEGIYMILTSPAGDTISSAQTAKATAGLDTYAAKLMLGDWLYWYDATNLQTRLVSPQAFTAGILAAPPPQQSSLNKRITGIIGSQRSGLVASGQAATYSTAEESALFSAGIDVICNPAPGGAYWAVRCGHNTSSNGTTNGDSYTRMTNYIAATLASGMGAYIGRNINSALFTDISTTLLSFFSVMLSQGLLGSTDGSLPYAVVCDTSNNPPARTGLGYVQADVAVQYQGINEKFILNLSGGSTVQITRAGGT